MKEEANERRSSSPRFRLYLAFASFLNLLRDDDWIWDALGFHKMGS